TYTLGNRRISQSQNGQTHYFGTDNQGSVKFLTDSTGLTDDYSYDSFGVLKNQSGSTDNAFRYTGEQFDKTLNMYNLRARYYAPEIGRFYGLDSYQGQLSDPESLHKYLYTANDPVNMVDPSGHFGMGIGGFSMGLTMISVIHMGLVTGTVGARIDEDKTPDGIILSYRMSGSKRLGLTGGGDIVVDWTGEVWLYYSYGLLFDPTTMGKPSLNFSELSMGPIWNMSSSSGFEGSGTTAVWPVASAKVVSWLVKNRSAKGFYKKFTNGVKKDLA
ncbi:MAG: hypothetical protein CSA42_08220, partial [Gammaproteobacteria bacterium]